MDIWLNRQAGARNAPLLFHGLGTTQCPVEDAIAADPFLLFLGEDPQVRHMNPPQLSWSEVRRGTAITGSLAP